MHPLLLVQELIESIFQQVDDRSALSRLARACRVFKEPALDALYANPLSLSDLLRCLPHELWHFVHRTIQSARVLTFSRGMTPEDWETLRSFSRRVKTIAVDARDSGEESRTIDACVYRALSACPLSSLFPKLQTLHVQGTTMYSPNYRFLMTQDLLLSSNLRAIHVTSMLPNSFFSDAPLLTKFCPLIWTFPCCAGWCTPYSTAFIRFYY